jgi:hypothetical protein
MTHCPHGHALIIVDGEMGKQSSNKFVITSNTGPVGNCAWPMTAFAFSTERCLSTDLPGRKNEYVHTRRLQREEDNEEEED